MAQLLGCALVIAHLQLTIACSSDDAVQPESVITVDNYTPNDFDRWLEANYVNPYNIDFKYRYEEIESDLDYYTVPAPMEASIQMAHLVKYLCIESYDEVAGINFTRRNFPKEFFLIGEFEYRNNGTMAAGTAEGGKKIVLMGLIHLTQFLSNAELLNQYYIKTIHHEFTHILNQTKNYTTDFNQITGSGYVADNWSDGVMSDESVYLRRGFISAYAQMEHHEDFAEMVAEYVTHSEDWWQAQLEKADGIYDANTQGTLTGRQLLQTKLEIVKAYFETAWDIDLDELRTTVLRRQADVVAGKVDLNDLTIR